MYQWAENQVMPLGPGILWTPKNNGFKKSVMMAGTSFAALQWLQWIQQSDICVDSSGRRIQLQHAYNQGEKVLNGYKLDGYLEKDGKEYYFEYNGKFFTSYYMDNIT